MQQPNMVNSSRFSLWYTHTPVYHVRCTRYIVHCTMYVIVALPSTYIVLCSTRYTVKVYKVLPTETHFARALEPQIHSRTRYLAAVELSSDGIEFSAPAAAAAP